MISTQQIVAPFREVPRAEWWVSDVPRPDRLTAYHNQDFIVQSFQVAGGIIRLAINRNQRILSPWVWQDGIAWSQIRAIKQSLGYGDKCGVEIYPPEQHILNIVNVRHLWLLDRSPLPPIEAAKVEHIHRSQDYEVADSWLPQGFRRLSVLCRDEKESANELSWDILQAIKEGCGYGDRSAFEYYPPTQGGGTPTYRHLWLPPERFAFEWDISAEGKTLNTGWDDLGKES